ncbi:sulfite exporter TauE/SafE family protein [Lutibaculum baratangense]|uniref:Probable membrane transporter protein n=1 Tax=Lutibaculum baratangense AMV1 TaxID=631454 RepID=V4RR11_9HYPH|nr:sulfite exporter TauE/SafE family protein [Lutibaculum baratangense]ESR25585.1 protein of unknown function DUF81 [Lutibaculum baratangense AMV1]
MTVAGIPVFEGLALWQFAALAAAYALAFLIKGVFGYGAVPPMILMGSLLMPPHEAVLLGGLVNLASQTFIIPDGIRHGDRALAGRMVIYIMPALVLGVFVFKYLPSDGLQLVVGIVLLAILLMEGSPAWRRLEPVFARRHRLFGSISAIIAGLMAGVVGAGAMVFLSIYLRTRASERMSFRGTVILIVTAILTWRTILFVGAGLIGWSLVLQAAIMLPLAAVFLLVGTRLAQTLSNSVYFRAYQVFMIMAAVLLIVRGLI